MLYKIEVVDFKRIKAALVVASTGTVVGITGQNCVGKSSFSDAIAAVLGGKAAIGDTDQPIRRGAKKAKIILDTEDWRAEQVFTEKTSTLRVVDKNGEAWTEPRSRFAKMIAPFSFDVTSFCRLKPKEMRDALIRACGLGDKLAEIDRKRAAVYTQRTDANRERERLQGALATLPQPAAGVPLEEVSVDDAMAEFEAAQKKHAARQLMVNELQRAEDLVERNADLVERLKRELAGARVQLAESETARDVKRVQLENEPEVDLDAAAEKMRSLEKINATVREADRYQTVQSDLDKAEGAWLALDQEVKAFDDEKKALVTGLELPIDGLEITDDGVNLDSIPLGQASQSARIKVGLAVSMAADPPVRIARITDASLLDEESIATVEQWAIDSDYLVLMEFVSADLVGMQNEVLIEDGEVVKAVSA